LAFIPFGYVTTDASPQQWRHPGEGRGPFLATNCRSMNKMDAEPKASGAKQVQHDEK
jgi:hypothetical protein